MTRCQTRRWKGGQAPARVHRRPSAIISRQVTSSATATAASAVGCERRVKVKRLAPWSCILCMLHCCQCVQRSSVARCASCALLIAQGMARSYRCIACTIRKLSPTNSTPKWKWGRSSYGAESHSQSCPFSPGRAAHEAKESTAERVWAAHEPLTVIGVFCSADAVSATRKVVTISHTDLPSAPLDMVFFITICDH